MLASAVGGLLTRTLVSSQVECVTENACVYSFYMLMWLLCDLNAAKLFCCEFTHFGCSSTCLRILRLCSHPAPQCSAIWVWVSARDRYIWTVSYVPIELPQSQ